MRDGRWEITNPTGNEKRRMTRDRKREMGDGRWEKTTGNEKRRMREEVGHGREEMRVSKMKDAR